MVCQQLHLKMSDDTASINYSNYSVNILGQCALVLRTQNAHFAVAIGVFDFLVWLDHIFFLHISCCTCIEHYCDQHILPMYLIFVWLRPSAKNCNAQSKYIASDFNGLLLFGILIAKKLVYTYRLAHFKHIRAWNRKPFCAKLKFSAVCIINFAHFVFIWILLLKSHCQCNSSSSIRFVRLNGTLYDTNELLFSRWPGLVHNIFPSFDHKLHLNRNTL